MNEFNTTEMSKNELAVFNVIPYGYRSKPPIKIKKIKELTGINERSIYKAIDNLVKKHKVPIVGLRKKPYGYFIAESMVQIYYYSREYTNQISSELERMEKLREAFNGNQANKGADHV